MQFSFGQGLSRRSLGEDGSSERNISAGKCDRHFTACPCESVCACRVEASCEAWSVANQKNKKGLK